MANPVQGIAFASCLDYELCAGQIYTELVNLGYITENGTKVGLRLPEEPCLRALEKGLEKWEEKIVNQLGDVTVRNYQRFSDVVIGVNADIQILTAQEMGHYCELEYAKQYPVFKTTLGGNVGKMVENLSVEDMEVDGKGKDEKGKETPSDETMDTSEELPTKTWKMFPLSIQPEVAHALVHLGKLEQVPTTVQDVILQIQAVCNITYIVSPKYILSSLAGTEKTSKLKGDFTVQLNLGRTVNRKPQEVSEITTLALLLSFPGKNRVLKKYNRRIESQKFYHEQNPENTPASITVPMQDIKEILRSFQQYVYNNSRPYVERRQATVVLNDAEAEAECKQKLFSWLDAVNDDPNSLLTEELFTKRLLQFSLVESYWPSESVIQKLTELRYLEVHDDQINYNPNYRGWSHVEDWQSCQKFLARWNTDQKPLHLYTLREGKLDINRQPTRKRSSTFMYANEAKKAKVLDL